MKYVYIPLGFICFVLGAAGAVLPVLPTAPFLLAASFCFAKGSARFHRWLTGTALYQKHLAELVKTGAMPRKSKAAILAFTTAMLAAAFLMMHSLYGRCFIILLLAVKYYIFLFRIKTIPTPKTYCPSTQTLEKAPMQNAR